MKQEIQSFNEASPVWASGEISAAQLLTELQHHRGKKIVFRYDGRDVLPGYHVTEVKTGAFQALDCGANYESWHETFIQLWDVPPQDERGPLTVTTFLAIVDKVAKAVPFDPGAKLTFEVSDGNVAMQLYRASGMEVEADAVRVELTQRPASCKPRDRWLEERRSDTADTKASCCGPAPAGASRRCN